MSHHSRAPSSCIIEEAEKLYPRTTERHWEDGLFSCFCSASHFGSFVLSSLFPCVAMGQIGTKTGGITRGFMTGLLTALFVTGWVLTATFYLFIILYEITAIENRRSSHLEVQPKIIFLILVLHLIISGIIYHQRRIVVKSHAIRETRCDGRMFSWCCPVLSVYQQHRQVMRPRVADGGFLLRV